MAGYDTRPIFKRNLTPLNSEFFFLPLTGYLIKAREPSLSYYLLIAGRRIIGFIPFPTILVLWELQFDSSRIWTRIPVCIACDNNYNTTGTSYICIYIHVSNQMLSVIHIHTETQAHAYIYIYIYIYVFIRLVWIYHKFIKNMRVPKSVYTKGKKLFNSTKIVVFITVVIHVIFMDMYVVGITTRVFRLVDLSMLSVPTLCF